MTEWRKTAGCVTFVQDIVGLFKQFFGQGRIFVQVFSHAHELGTLSGKYKCFHIYLFIK